MPELHKKSFNTASGQVSNSQMLLFVWGVQCCERLCDFNLRTAWKTKKLKWSYNMMFRVYLRKVLMFRHFLEARGASGVLWRGN